MTIELEPLSEADTGHLLETLLSSHRLPTGVGPALLAAAGGNPLFAEEYVRMVRDHHPLPGRPAERGCPCPRPSTPSSPPAWTPCRPRRRPDLQDLSVLGRVGWVGALAAVSGRARAEVEACLERLRAKEFLYRAGRRPWPGSASTGSGTCWSARSPTARSRGWSGPTSTAGPPPGWSRWPPSARSCWPTTTGGPSSWPAPPGRPPASWPSGPAWPCATPATGSRGLGAHPTAARYYTQALAIWPEDDPERPDLELAPARTAYSLGEGAGEDLLTRARDGLLAMGDRARAAEAEAHLGLLAYAKGRERSAHLDRALALVADPPPSHCKAVVLSHA